MAVYEVITVPVFNDNGTQSTRYSVAKDGVIIANTTSTAPVYATEIVTALNASS